MSSAPVGVECLGSKPSATSLERWAKRRKIFLHPQVAFLVPTRTMGLGIFARYPLEAGTVIISCPATSALSPYSEATAEAPSVAVVRAHASPGSSLHEDSALQVVLRLMAEVCRKGTPWRPWLEACPRMRQHLFDLSAEQKAALGVASEEGGRTHLDTRRWTTLSEQLREINVDGRWAIAREVMASHPDVWPPALASFELFCECVAQVFSRNFHREEIVGREGPYLLPGVDFINHSFASNAEFTIMGGARKYETTFTVKAARPLLKGEQVFCSYGHIGAARFAVEFQFLTQSVLREDMSRFSASCLAEVAQSLHEQCESTVPAEQLRADLSKRIERLQQLGFLYDEGLYLQRPLSEDDFAKVEDGKQAYAKRRGEVEEVVRVFLCVVHLLMVDHATFVDLFHRVSRSWFAPCTNTLRGHALAMLEAKRAAAQAQEGQAAEVFDGADPLISSQRALVQGALHSEQEILLAYQELVKDWPTSV